MTRGVKKGTKRGSYNTAPEKTKAFAGYKYTPKEYEKIRECLESYAAKKGITKSKALYELITQATK
jgi:hypothetical protein